jgi:hypothetical protein
MCPRENYWQPSGQAFVEAAGVEDGHLLVAVDREKKAMRYFAARELLLTLSAHSHGTRKRIKISAVLTSSGRFRENLFTGNE